MYARVISDRTGLEPNGMFNLVQFMMYDKDNSGCVQIDEMMHLFYARYGGRELELHMKALFGDDMRSKKMDESSGELSFARYLVAVTSSEKADAPKKAGSKKGR